MTDQDDKRFDMVKEIQIGFGLSRADYRRLVEKEIQFATMITDLIEHHGWQKILLNRPIHNFHEWAKTNLIGKYHLRCEPSVNDFIVVENSSDAQIVKDHAFVLTHRIELDHKKLTEIKSWCKKTMGSEWNILHKPKGRWLINLAYDGNRESMQRGYHVLSLRDDRDVTMFALRWM